MITRSICVMLVIGIGGVYTWLTPPPLPAPPEGTRWVKIDTNGKQLSPWSGPWKCVLDTHTQLIWEVKSYAEDIHDHQCSFSWFDAEKGVEKRGDCFIEGEASDTHDLISAANTYRYCGLSSWRLPTTHELRSLLITQPKPGDALIARDYFPYAKRAPYWTANAEQPLDGHFRRLGKGATAVDFATGQSQNMPYKNAAFVRLVSSIQDH